MAKVDLTIEICGMSGDGTIAAGGILNEAMSRAGLSVLAFDSYPAEIRGFGRCVTHSRVGDQEMRALSDKTHALISLDDKESQSRTSFLAKDAVVIFDNKPPSYGEEGASIAAHVEPDARLFGMPFSDLAAAASGSTRGRNLTALGGFAAIFGVPPRHFQEVVTKKFKAKGEKVLDANLKSFDAGYRYASEALRRGNGRFSHCRSRRRRKRSSFPETKRLPVRPSTQVSSSTSAIPSPPRHRSWSIWPRRCRSGEEEWCRWKMRLPPSARSWVASLQEKGP